MKGRGPVVFLDRSKKARMISAILEDHLNQKIVNLRTLDIGCGNGGISDYFSNHNEHYAVDIKDQRDNGGGGYQFFLVGSEYLPFENEFFDVVISNHVIEHVSDHGRHLGEIRRVLKPGGVVYMATPNRSSPIMEGHVGNDMVLRYRDMGPLFSESGFTFQEYGVALAKEPGRFSGEVMYAQYFPRFMLRMLRWAFPSHVFVLTKENP